MKRVRRLYTVLWYIVWPFFSLVHPCRLIGRERLPKEGGLFCANHSALIDPLCLCMALGPNYQVRGMAKAEFMSIPVLGWLLKKAGFFAVERGKSDVGAMKTAIRYLKDGENVLLFPEGTRIKNGVDKYGNPGQAKAGAAMLAVRTGVWVVPVYIPEKKPWFRFTRIQVGQPYRPETQVRRAGSGEYQSIADGVMERIYALGGQESGHED